MADNVRLLQCLDCKTLETLPDYQGDPREDVLLDVLTSRHVFPGGNRHRGHLHRVEARHWESPSTRAAIEKQIQDASGWTGLDPSFYAAKDTYTQDALSCWGQHNRTRACGDYKSEAKVLTPDTLALRREVARMTKHEDVAYSAPKRYLCEFCPVHSLVMQAKRRKAGLDK
jgi:hypothetical protein